MPKNYKIVVFGLGGVVFERPWEDPTEDIAISTWDVLFKILGIYDEHERLKNIFLRGGFKTYGDWSDAACCVLKASGLNREMFEKVINSLPFMQGAIETFRALHTNKIITGVGGGFEALALRAKRELNIDHVEAHCRFEFDEEGKLKDWKLLATDYKDKIKFIKFIAQINKVDLDQCAYVGGDISDIPIFKKVGLSVAFNSTKQIVKEEAKVVIESKDLREILPHLGLKK